jgi:actin-related protein
MGIHRAVQQTARALPAEERAHLSSHVLLTGGTSMFPGLLPRLQAELAGRGGAAGSGANGATSGVGLAGMRVLGSQSRSLDVWTGGYAYASSILSAYPDLLASRTDYAEDGVLAVHRRCVV